MPELPDLQVFSVNLSRQLAGITLEKIKTYSTKSISVPETKLQKAIDGKTVKQVLREGKELWFIFHNNEVLAIHLMLRGKLSWVDEDEKRPAYAMLEMFFSNGNRLVLSDYQRNAKVTLNPPPVTVPDAISKEANVQFWKLHLKSKATIKNRILNQKVVRGIGNAYADEILWDAGISPFSISNKIPPAKINVLSKSVKKVLKEAEKKIRKKAPGIIGGEIRDFLQVHNSSRKNSPRGAAIKVKAAGARKTYYTSEQRLYK